MSKKIISIVNVLLGVTLLCSCSNATTASNTEIQPIAETTVQENAETVSNQTMKTVTEYSEIDISNFNCPNATLAAYSGDKLFTTVFSSDNLMEIYIIDTSSGTQKSICQFEWSVMYDFLYQVINERYFVIMPSENAESGLKSTLYIYDIETEEFYEGSSFLAHNIVQYMTNINDNELAYMYYENETERKVIEIYNLETRESREVYSISADDKFSPMGLSFNGQNLVLALQYYNEDFETETVIKEISLTGTEENVVSTTNFPLPLIHNIKYDGNNLIVCGNQYRASTELSTVYVKINNGSIDTVIPLEKGLQRPLNYLNGSDGSNLYRCGDKSDFAIVDSDCTVQYFNVDVPNCQFTYAAICNEENDMAVIKYSDENFSDAKLLIVKAEDM